MKVSTPTRRDRAREHAPEGGGRNRQTATVTAHLRTAWSGTFKTRAILIRHGKRLDTCELKRVTWSAS